MAYGSVSVTTSPTLIVAANSLRQSLLIVNTNTSNKLYIGPDSNVTTSNGIEIEATGGSLSEDSGGQKIYTGSIYGIAGSSIDVRYWERTSN